MNDTEKMLLQLGEKNHKRNEKLIVLKRGSMEWKAWRNWRVENGLSVAFMDSRAEWTVPSELPPVNLAAAVQSAGGWKLRLSE